MTKFCKFCDICNFFAEFSRKLLFFQTIFCENFEIAAVQKNSNLVELEKCCRTHIFLLSPNPNPLKTQSIAVAAGWGAPRRKPAWTTSRPSPNFIAMRTSGCVLTHAVPGWDARSWPSVGWMLLNFGLSGKKVSHIFGSFSAVSAEIVASGHSLYVFP